MYKKLLLFLALVNFPLLGCDVKGSQEKWKLPNGNEYRIISTSAFTTKNNEMLFTVTYLSKSPAEKTVTQKEFSDLFQYIKSNIDIKRYDYVGVRAEGKLFYYFSPYIASCADCNQELKAVSEILYSLN